LAGVQFDIGEFGIRTRRRNLGAAPYTPDAISDRGVLSRIVNHHPIAIQAAAKKLIGRSPQIQAEAPIVEFAETLDNEILLGVEVAGPFLEGEEIAVTVVEDLQRSQRRLGKLVEKSCRPRKEWFPAVLGRSGRLIA
jgi:hypothetical protein